MTKIEDLIDKIIIKAEKEADIIVNKAIDSAKSKTLLQEKRSARALRDSEKKSILQSKEIYVKKQRLTSMYSNRAILQNREDFIERVIHMAVKKIEERMNRSDYIKTLQDLILEGAIGLQRDEMYLNSSEYEKNLITAEVLDRVCRVASEVTGKKIKINISKEKPLLNQGIIVKSVDGRILYNNQIDIRVTRKKSEINKIISEYIDKMDISHG